MFGERPGSPLPEPRAPGPVQPPAIRRSAWQFWLAVTMGMFVIWLISGASGGQWFLWTAIPPAFILLRHWTLGRGRERCHGRP